MRPLPALSTLIAPDNDHLPRSGRMTFSVARLRASFDLAVNPRTRRQDASNSLLQPTFRATSTHDKHHLWRLPIEHRGKPASVRFRDRLLDCGRSWRSRFLGRRRTTLRSSGPPTAARLTTRCRLRADRLSRSSAFGARREESSAALSACESSAESNPLTPLVDGCAWCALARQRRSRVSPFPSEHVNAPTFQSSRCLPPERIRASVLSGRLPGKRPFGRLLRKRPFERLRGVPALRWPAAAVTTRVHRGSKTPTRPLPARYSRTSSRPRAPLRFLQVDVSTSTTGTARTSRTTGGGRDDCHVGREE